MSFMQDQIKVEKINDIECEININVSSEKVDKKFSELVISLAPQTQIPGFRKGKAPTPILKQFLWEKSKPLIAQSLIGECYTEAIKDHNISPVCSPRVKDFRAEAAYQGVFGPDKSFYISLLVETLPKINPIGYKGLSFSMPEYNIEQLVSNKLLTHQEQFAERKQITDRGVQINDAIVLDFIVISDGKQIDQSTSFAINKVGTGETLADFEQGLLGLKISEKKSIAIKFPNNYRVPNLSNKDAIFNVELRSIVDVKPAAVDTDLAMMVGFETIEAMMQNIRDTVQKELFIKNRQTLDYQAMTKLIELNTFNVPVTLIQAEQKRLLGKQDYNSLDNNVKTGLYKLSEFNVKRAILIESIYEHETELEISPEELNVALEEQSKLSGKTKDEITSNLYNSGQMDGFVGTLKYIKVVDFIIKNSNQTSATENISSPTKEKENE